MAPRKTRNSQGAAVGPTPPASSDYANVGRVLRKRRYSKSTEVTANELATPLTMKKQKQSVTEQDGPSNSTKKVPARSQNATSKASIAPSQALARRPAGHGPQLMHRPTTEMMLTFQHSVELVRISITASVFYSFSQILRGRN